MKNIVETRLRRRVCKGQLTLEQAQHIIRTDWIAEYQAEEATEAAEGK